VNAKDKTEVIFHIRYLRGMC